MVQILEANPSFGSSLGAALGRGVATGATRALEFKQQMDMERAKLQQRKQLVDEFRRSKLEPESLAPLQGEERNKFFLEILPQLEEQKVKQFGDSLTQDEVEDVWKNLDQIHTLAKPRQQREMQEEDPFREAEELELLGETGLSKIATEKAKIAEKRSEAQKGRHWEIAKKALESNAALAQSLPQKEMALSGMIDSIESGDLGFFSLDNLAELTGIEGLRSPEGAKFKAESKEFLMGNLSRVGAKGLNQWLEKQVNQMSPQIGRSKEANLVVAEFLKAEAALQKRQIETTNRIAQDYERKYGEFPMDLAERASKELHPYAVQLQKDLKESVEDIKERYQKVNPKGHLMRHPDGSLRRVPVKDYKAAKKAGYRDEK